jgi:hypothetical protein
MSIANVKDLEEYKEMFDNIIGLAQHEVTIISNGGSSCWNVDQLEKGVIPEMVELQQYILGGELFLKYGKQQRLLESTYMLTDSLNILNRTPLGLQISKLQRKIDFQK